MHEAFATALSAWPASGVPDNPRPWLISTARFKAIDTLRRRAKFDASQDEPVRYLEVSGESPRGIEIRTVGLCCRFFFLCNGHSGNWGYCRAISETS